MVLAELVTYLEAQGVGTPATDLFYGFVPDTPDSLVCLMEYGGLRNEPELGGTTVRLEFPRVQVITRGAKQDYDTPRQKIQDVVVAFTKIGTQALSGVEYKAVEALQPPFLLKRDDLFRFVFVCNFQVTKNFSNR